MLLGVDTHGFGYCLSFCILGKAMGVIKLLYHCLLRACVTPRETLCILFSIISNFC